MTGEMLDIMICPDCKEHCDCIDEDNENEVSDIKDYLRED
jgi:uncharacterized protein YbaR (Trm112 family)